MTNKFTHISLKDDTKQRLKDLMAKHPRFYTDYDKTINFLLMLGENYSPHILIQVVKQPYVQGEMTEADYDSPRRNKIIEAQLDLMEKDNEKEIKELDQ